MDLTQADADTPYWVWTPSDPFIQSEESTSEVYKALCPWRMWLLCHAIWLDLRKTLIVLHRVSVKHYHVFKVTESLPFVWFVTNGCDNWRELNLKIVNTASFKHGLGTKSCPTLSFEMSDVLQETFNSGSNANVTDYYGICCHDTL